MIESSIHGVHKEFMFFRGLVAIPTVVLILERVDAGPDPQRFPSVPLLLALLF